MLLSPLSLNLFSHSFTPDDDDGSIARQYLEMKGFDNTNILTASMIVTHLRFGREMTQWLKPIIAS